MMVFVPPPPPRKFWFKLYHNFLSLSSKAIDKDFKEVKSSKSSRSADSQYEAPSLELTNKYSALRSNWPHAHDPTHPIHPPYSRWSIHATNLVLKTFAILVIMR